MLDKIEKIVAEELFEVLGPQKIQEYAEMLLAEGRKEDVAKKYPEFAERGIIQTFSENDPSGNNAYLGWMAKQLNDFYSLTRAVQDKPEQMAMRREFVDKIVNSVKKFHQNKQRLQKKDIYQYYSIGDVEDAVGELGQTRSQKRKFEKEQALEGSEIIFEDENFFAIRPLTAKASCHYGARSKWCISARGNNYFDNYTSEGKGFVFVRLNNLAGTDDAEREFALVYDRDGSLETTFDIDDVEGAEESFHDASAVNILEGIFAGTKYEGKGREMYAEIYSDVNTAMEDKPAPGIYKAIAKKIESQYSEFIEEEIDIDEAELYELSDWIMSTIQRPSYEISYAGGSHVEANPPGPNVEALDEIQEEFDANVKHSHITYEMDDYGDAGFYFNGGMSLEIKDAPLGEWSEKVQDEADSYDSDTEDKIKDYAIEALNNNNIYPDEMYIDWQAPWDREKGAYSGEKTLHLRMDFHREYEDATVQGFRDYANRVKEYDDNADEAIQDFMNLCIKGLLLKSDAYTSIEDTKNELLGILNHFDEAEVGDGEVTFYGDLVLQVPRMPAFILDLSKRAGTAAEPGPLGWFRERVTGPYRNNDETIVKFYLMKVIKEFNDFNLDREWRTQMARVLNKVYDREAAQTKAQGKLDLQEQEDFNLYQSAEFEWNVVKTQRIYHPQSGKMTIPFYIEVPIRDSTIETSLKFVKDVDRLWDTIETSYENTMTKYISAWYEKQVSTLKSALEQATPPSEPKDSEKEKEGEFAMQEEVKRWSKFLK